jgi:hypothetical protein
MAERHPGWVNGVEAAEARLATGMLVTAQGTGDTLDPLRVRSGIRDANGQPGLAILGANKVTVNPFQAVIADSAKPADGPYFVTLDAVKEFPFGAAHASLSRTDLVVAEVSESGVFAVTLYQGENSAVSPPPRPAVANPAFLELATITVPPVGTPAKLTDTRRFTAALNGILPVRNADDRPSATTQYSQFVFRLDTGVLEIRKSAGWVPYRPPRGDTWHAATLQNKWVNYGAPYNSAAYTLTDDGWVRLRGLVKSGTLDTSIFTLPVGYRPPAQCLFPISTSPDTVGRVDVHADGRVMATTGNVSWMSLDGLAFATY